MYTLICQHVGRRYVILLTLNKNYLFDLFYYNKKMLLLQNHLWLWTTKPSQRVKSQRKHIYTASEYRSNYMRIVMKLCQYIHIHICTCWMIINICSDYVRTILLISMILSITINTIVQFVQYEKYVLCSLSSMCNMYSM